MRELSITPTITVTIGRHTRLYTAYVTTAPPALDLPHTITLNEGPFSKIVGLARRSDLAPRDPRTHAGTAGPRRRNATHRTAGELPRTPPSAAAGRPVARRTQHAAVLALAAPPGARQRNGGRMTRSTHAFASTARGIRELFRRSRYESRRQNHAERQRPPARQTRRCRTALHRRRTRRLEADRLQHLGATQWQRPQRHVPGAPVRRQW